MGNGEIQIRMSYPGAIVFIEHSARREPRFLDLAAFNRGISRKRGRRDLR